MAQPTPSPDDWLAAARAQQQAGDREVLQLLRDSYRRVQQILKGLPQDDSGGISALISRAQYERTRQELLAEQARVFRRLGDVVSARRLEAAARSAKLSATADAAFLRVVGAGRLGQQLIETAQATARRGIEVAMIRLGLSAVPLSERIYNTSVWMHNRLNRLINQQLAIGLNARKFAKVARDWFNPSVPGGTRYAALRLARTEINNAFHAEAIARSQAKPWVQEMDWNLSKSHPKPDECNVLAAQSPFKVTEVPRRPHPQCMCFVTEHPIDEEEWVDRFVAGEFDDWLDAELGEEPPVREERQEQQQIAPPAPEPKPEPKPTGYVPGNWTKQTDNEEDIVGLMKEIAKLVPADKHAENEARLGPNWLRISAEQMLAGNDDNEVRYHNGPHRIRFSGRMAENEAVHQQFLADFDFMETNYSTGHEMRINMAPAKEFDEGVGGETTISTGSMFLNEEYLEGGKKDLWSGMPVRFKFSSMQYILAHEWGHALSTKDEARESHTHDQAIKAGKMTPYGKTEPAEGYAEAFAEWSLSKGKTKNPAALVYAERFRWGERFGLN